MCGEKNETKGFSNLLNCLPSLITRLKQISPIYKMKNNFIFEMAPFIFISMRIF